MCGSEEGLNRENGMLKTMLSCVLDDGRLYCPGDFGGTPKDTSYPFVNGNLALACETHYALDGNPGWLDWVQLLASGLKKWQSGLTTVPIILLKAASLPKANGCGIYAAKRRSLMIHPRNLFWKSKAWRSVKVEQAFDDAGAREGLPVRRGSGEHWGAAVLTRFDLKPGMWDNTTLEGYKGNEHGIFLGISMATQHPY